MPCKPGRRESGRKKGNMNTLKPTHIFEGMTIYADAGFPCRRWMRRLDERRGKPEVLQPINYYAPADMANIPADAPLDCPTIKLVVLWAQPPYVVAEHTDELFPITSRLWFDSREVELSIDG